MKIGVCIGSSLWKAEYLKEYGYDFAELCVVDFGKFTQTEYDEYKEKVKNLKVPAVSANCYLPGSLKINRLQRDDAAIEDYVRLTAKRASGLGIERIVFGSGSARKCPDELSREECLEDIVHFIGKVAAPELAKYGIRLLIEPLAGVFCNMITTVKEGVRIVEELGLDNVLCLADNYHMDHEGEELTSISEYRGKVLHSHISTQDISVPGYGRYFPKEDDGYDLTPFTSSLIKCGCDMCAIEAETTDETFAKDAELAIEVIKKAIMKG